MRMIDIIEKKRDGKSLSKEEIEFFIKGYTEGDIPDYQASSLAMAIFFQDMNEEERAALTMAMVNSGDVIDLSKVNGIKVDKHSTGGVGDTTTLVLASSIMSKKIAAGADAIVLDVKTGNGAFMKTLEDAEALAHAMVSIGNNVGRNTMAIISDMSQPLGRAIGNALELKEAIDTLNGQGPEDLTELVLTLGSQMVVLAERASTLEEARQLLNEAIENGSALDKFKTFLENQGGDASVVDSPELLPTAEYQIDYKAKSSGVVSELIANEIGVASMMLGAGRQTKEDDIDLSVGIVLNKKVGDNVNEGESLLTIHSNRENVDDVIKKLDESIEIKAQAKTPTLIHKIITE